MPNFLKNQFFGALVGYAVGIALVVIIPMIWNVRYNWGNQND